jgi:dTDP-4-amino-4,6-dideoxygalactose transaminase
MVIEDAAHAHGVEYDGRKYAGTFGDFGCFSLQEAKNVATGEGGILLTDNRELYDKAFSLHHYGRIPGEIWYKHFTQGWNYRMNEVTGALAINQTRRLKEQNQRRMENYEHLEKGLAGIPGIKLCKSDPRITRHSHHLVMIRYDKAATGGVHRDDIVAALVKEGIPALTGYTFPNYANPFMASEETKARFRAAGIELPNYPAYSECCLNTERACYEESIWLTHGLLLGTRQDMEDIVEAFAKVLGAHG